MMDRNPNVELQQWVDKVKSFISWSVNDLHKQSLNWKTINSNDEWRNQRKSIPFEEEEGLFLQDS